MVRHSFSSISGVLGGKNSNDTEGGFKPESLSSLESKWVGMRFTLLVYHKRSLTMGKDAINNKHYAIGEMRGSKDFTRRGKFEVAFLSLIGLNCDKNTTFALISCGSPYRSSGQIWGFNPILTSFW
jgi:hypothetical protein